MKREGRQHGMVRTHMNLPSPYNPKPASKVYNKLDSPPTAGIFSRVQPKPTNHSKFTGKCGKPRCVVCHLHPCCKSKDKTKGGLKIKSHDVVSNHKLLNWRVVDSKPRLILFGNSARGLLDQLASDVDQDVQIDYDDGYGDGYDDHVSSHEELYDDDYENSNKIEDVNGGDDDDKISYCDVGFFVVDHVDGEEGWCMVAEMC